jgi:hypothetical protein
MASMALLLSSALCSLALPAQDLFGGVQFQTAWALDQGLPTLGRDLGGHPGFGLGGYMGLRLTERNAFKVTLAFTGSEVASWRLTSPITIDPPEYRDIWRDLRLGVEHEVELLPSGRLVLTYGGGIENTWVNRAEGSYLEVSLLVLAWLGKATEGSARYLNKRTVLDGWSPFGTAGLGYRGRRGLCVDLQYLAGSYLRYRDHGLRTQQDGPTERRLGNRVVLTVGFRLGD